MSIHYDQVDMIMKLAEIHEKLIIAENMNAQQELGGILGALHSISDMCDRIIDDVKQSAIDRE